MASDFAQIVKQQADIVKIIGDYVRLKKSGAQNYAGLCPFHSEKSPSFSVHATRQFFHCFGCGQSGDVFSFLQKIENLTFPESVRAVAQKCGIPLPKRDFNSSEEAQESRQRGKLLDLHESATVWFQDQLKSAEGAGAREYLTSRGLTPEAIAKFRIGFAPDSYTALRDRLAPGADPEALRASGLFSWKEQENGKPGTLYTRFRKRITFPIANEAGRVIAFTARALDTAVVGSEKAGPKYLNSPETPLYSKGQVLFNLDKARAGIRQLNFALLVEGQMDCIAVSMSGVQNVLATSGTAFTEHQVNLLKRYCTQVVVNFDPDTAGANAAEKSIALLTEEGFTVKVISLADGLDPDRYIRERGAAAYHAAARAAQSLPDYLIDRARQLFPPRSPEAKVKALNFLLPHIRRMPNRLSREQFAADAAQKLAIDSAVMRKEWIDATVDRRGGILSAEDYVSQASTFKRFQIGRKEQVVTGISQLERTLIRILADGTKEERSKITELLEDNLEILGSFRYGELLMLLAKTDEGLAMENPDFSPDDRGVLAAVFEESADHDFDSVITELNRQITTKRLALLKMRMVQAQRSGDDVEFLALASQVSKIGISLLELNRRSS